MKVEAFVDRKGKELSEKEWQLLRKDRNYSTIREFGNRQFHVRAIWVGKLHYFAKNEVDAKAKWKPFELIVLEDRDGHPTLRADDSRGYPDESSLINAYEDFLVRHRLAEWFPSTVDGEYHFIEKGNLMKSNGDTPAIMGVGDAIEAACSW